MPRDNLKCIAHRLGCCDEPPLGIVKQGACKKHADGITEVSWDRCRLSLVTRWPFDIQKGTRLNAALKHKHLPDKGIDLIAHPYALDDYSLVVFKTAEDADTATKFMREQYPAAAHQRLQLLPLVEGDTVPPQTRGADDAASPWRGNVVRFKYHKNRKELIPITVLDRWSKSVSPSAALSPHRRGRRGSPSTSPSPMRSLCSDEDDEKDVVASSSAHRSFGLANANANASAHQTLANIEREVAALRSALSADLGASQESDRMKSLQAENWRLTELVNQYEATIKQQEATIAALRNGSASPNAMFALSGPTHTSVSMNNGRMPDVTLQPTMNGDFPGEQLMLPNGVSSSGPMNMTSLSGEQSDLGVSSMSSSMPNGGVVPSASSSSYVLNGDGVGMSSSSLNGVDTNMSSSMPNGHNVHASSSSIPNGHHDVGAPSSSFMSNSTDMSSSSALPNGHGVLGTLSPMRNGHANTMSSSSSSMPSDRLVDTSSSSMLDGHGGGTSSSSSMPSGHGATSVSSLPNGLNANPTGATSILSMDSTVDINSVQMQPAYALHLAPDTSSSFASALSQQAFSSAAASSAVVGETDFNMTDAQPVFASTLSQQVYSSGASSSAIGGASTNFHMANGSSSFASTLSQQPFPSGATGSGVADFTMTDASSAAPGNSFESSKKRKLVETDIDIVGQGQSGMNSARDNGALLFGGGVSSDNPYAASTNSMLLGGAGGLVGVGCGAGVNVGVGVGATSAELRFNDGDRSILLRSAGPGPAMLRSAGPAAPAMRSAAEWAKVKEILSMEERAASPPQKELSSHARETITEDSASDTDITPKEDTPQLSKSQSDDEVSQHSENVLEDEASQHSLRTPKEEASQQSRKEIKEEVAVRQHEEEASTPVRASRVPSLPCNCNPWVICERSTISSAASTSSQAASTSSQAASTSSQAASTSSHAASTSSHAASLTSQAKPSTTTKKEREERIEHFLKENSRALLYFWKYLKQSENVDPALELGEPRYISPGPKTIYLRFYQECSRFLTQRECGDDGREDSGDPSELAKVLMSKFLSDDNDQKINLLPSIECSLVNALADGNHKQFHDYVRLARSAAHQQLLAYFAEFLQSDSYASYLEKMEKKFLKKRKKKLKRRKKKVEETDSNSETPRSDPASSSNSGDTSSSETVCSDPASSSNSADDSSSETPRSDPASSNAADDSSSETPRSDPASSNDSQSDAAYSSSCGTPRSPPPGSANKEFFDSEMQLLDALKELMREELLREENGESPTPRSAPPLARQDSGHTPVMYLGEAPVGHSEWHLVSTSDVLALESELESKTAERRKSRSKSTEGKGGAGGGKSAFSSMLKKLRTSLDAEKSSSAEKSPSAASTDADSPRGGRKSRSGSDDQRPSSSSSAASSPAGAHSPPAFPRCPGIPK